jgi:hypothetical protein
MGASAEWLERLTLESTNKLSEQTAEAADEPLYESSTGQTSTTP